MFLKLTSVLSLLKVSESPIKTYQELMFEKTSATSWPFSLKIHNWGHVKIVNAQKSSQTQTHLHTLALKILAPGLGDRRQGKSPPSILSFEKDFTKLQRNCETWCWPIHTLKVHWYDTYYVVSYTFPGFPALGEQNCLLKIKAAKNKKLCMITCILVSDYFEVVFLKSFFTIVNFF